MDGGSAPARPEDHVHVFEDAAALGAGVAARVADELGRAIRRQGFCSLVLAGGSTPEESFRRLARFPVDWSSIDVFWGDERCVPPDHPASNFGVARSLLLDPARAPAQRVHRIEGELGAAAAADRYERLLRARFDGRWPVFDLVLLGVGSDGHVASLFPGRGGDEGGGWVIPVECQPSDVDRVTLTMGVLTSARSVLILAAGEGKTEIVGRALAAQDRSLPVVRLVERVPGLIWMVDREAAAAIR